MWTLLGYDSNKSTIEKHFWDGQGKLNGKLGGIIANFVKCDNDTAVRFQSFTGWNDMSLISFILHQHKSTKLLQTKWSYFIGVLKKTEINGKIYHAYGLEI